MALQNVDSSIVSDNLDNYRTWPPALEQPATPLESRCMSDMVNSFRASLGNDQLAPNTRRVYASRIKQFLLFIQQNGLNFATEENFQDAANAYIGALRSLAAKATSINNSIVALEKFSAHLKYAPAKISRERRLFAQSARLAYAQEAQLRSTARECASLRDQVLLFLILDYSVRIGQCSALNIEHIRYVGDALIVDLPAAHGGLMRSINVTGEVRVLLERWLSERPLSQSPALFITHKRARLSPSGVDWIIRTIGIKAKVNICGETLRRTSRARAT